MKEKIFTEQYTDRGAYKVPQGYFDDLQKQILSKTVNMQSVEAGNMQSTEAAPHQSEKKVGVIVPMLPRMRYAIAACVSVLVIGVGALFYTIKSQEADVVAMQEEEVITEQYVTDCMEYAMVDGNDIYQYVADSEY